MSSLNSVGRFGLLTSPPIGEALAFDTGERAIRAGLVIDAQRHALVVSEIEFREVALQVLRRNVMIRSDDAALEDAEIAFDSVRVRVAANVLTKGVIDLLDVVIHRHRNAARRAFVSHKRGVRRQLRGQDRTQRSWP